MRHITHAGRLPANRPGTLRSRRASCRAAAGIACALALAASGCATAPPPPPESPLTIAAPPEAKAGARMTLAAATDVNPDASGRPSPVVVRVYQLRSDAAFGRVDFFELYDDEQKALGPELITRDQYMLTPGASQTINVAVSGETRFVGVIAAFRDIRNAEWRALVPVPRGGLTVAVDRARIAVSAAD